LFTLVWERWRFPKPTRPNSLRVYGASASRGGHYERPETQEPAKAESRRRQASRRRNQSQEIPKPAQPHTRLT